MASIGSKWSSSERFYQDWAADRAANDYTDIPTLLDALDAIGRDSITVGDSVASIARTASALLSEGEQRGVVDYK